MAADEQAKESMERIEKIDEKRVDARSRVAIAQQMSDEEFLDNEKSLKRKLDLRLTAMVVFIYILNFLDRNNIAASKIAGIEEDLRLTPTQFSTAVSLLFVGYILMQVPSNIFLAQLRPSIYLPVCMASWGIVSTCTGAVQSAAGLYAARFFLGFVEACFYPGCIFLLSSWYRRSELSLRCAVLYAGSQVGSAFSGLIAAGITSGMDGALGLRAWRWIFIIEGSVTVVVAISALFVLPDFPTNTKWLSPKEAAVAEWRLIKDAAGQTDEDDTAWSSGFKAAFKDWRTFVFAAIFHCVLVLTSVQNFFPTVVNTLGFGRIATLLLTVPPYAIGIALTVLNNYSADRLRNSSFHVMIPMTIAIVGFVIGAASLNTGARYFAMVLMIAGGHGSNAVVIAWVAKTMIRPRIKRAAAVAFVNACGNLAQVWTSYLYTGGAPRYVLAMSVNSGFAVGGIVLAVLMRLVLLRANKRLALAEMQDEESTLDEHDVGSQSARKRLTFRYVT